MRYVLSFDIDGTLDVGDPRGPLTFAMVEHALQQGHVVGSASDRTLADQRALWASSGLEPHFVSRKHELAVVRETFEADRYLHVGDTVHDRDSATTAGFEFLHVDDVLLDALPWSAA